MNGERETPSLFVLHVATMGTHGCQLTKVAPSHTDGAGGGDILQNFDL